jgi:MFS family permease
LTFGATLGGLGGPLLAGVLMARFGPWVPIWVVIFTTPIVIAIILAIPETLTLANKKADLDDEPTKKTFKAHITRGFQDLKESLSMLKNVNIPLILITFLSQNARFTAYTGTLGQYISKHFGWKLAETSILLSPLGILNLIILAILPKVSQYLMSPRVGFTTFRKDLFLTRVSTLLLIFGAIIEGFSHNIVLFILGLFIGTFGAADSPLARATITHYVPVEFTSRLYALIGIAEVLGAFIGGPVLAYCFNRGLALKGFWIGLPWFYIAFTCIACWVALLWVRPPKTESPPPQTYRDDDGAAPENDSL